MIGDNDPRTYDTRTAATLRFETVDGRVLGRNQDGIRMWMLVSSMGDDRV
jgi:hypothetical protein